MSATARTSWFWSDWLGDQAVRRLTPAERGVWIDLLALAAAAAPAGYVCDDKGRPLTHEEIARVTGTTPIEVAKLIAGILEKGAASRDRSGRIYNRRMVRDAQMSAKKRLNGKAGGAATRMKWQELSGLPRHNAWQAPQQRASAPNPISKTTSTFSAAARETQDKPQDKPQAAALARAPANGAAATKGTSEIGPPSSAGRAQLEEIYARKSSTRKE